MNGFLNFLCPQRNQKLNDCNTCCFSLFVYFWYFTKKYWYWEKKLEIFFLFTSVFIKLFCLKPSIKTCWISSGGFIAVYIVPWVRYFVLSFLKVNICFTWSIPLANAAISGYLLYFWPAGVVNIWTPLSKIWNLVASFTKLLTCRDAEKKSLIAESLVTNIPSITSSANKTTNK